MRWPGSPDAVQARIKAHGRLLSELHRKLERRIRWPLEPEVEWWTLVALRSAASGAALGIGEYQRRLQESARHAPAALTRLPADDPSFALTAALRDRSSLGAACRVLLWAYDSEMVAELWSPTYRAEMEMAARVLGLESDHETAVVRTGGSLERAAADWERGGQLEFRRNVLVELVGAATGLTVAAEHPWITTAVPTWLECYAHGQQVAASELKRLAPMMVDGAL